MFTDLKKVKQILFCFLWVTTVSSPIWAGIVHQEIELNSRQLNSQSNNQSDFLGTIVEIPAHLQESGSSAPLDVESQRLVAIFEERRQLGSLIPELERQLSNLNLSVNSKEENAAVELERLKARYGFLASEIIRLQNLKNSLKANVASQVEEEHDDGSKDQIKLLTLKYTAQIRFLKKYVTEVYNKLIEKSKKSPYFYDNRHYQFLSKKRKLSKNKIEEIKKRLEPAVSLIEQLKQKYIQKVEKLPVIDQNSQTIKVLEVNLADAVGIKTDLLEEARLLETKISNIVDNLTTKKSFKKRLIQNFFKKGEAGYIPKKLNAEDRQRLLEIKKVSIDRGNHSIDRFFEMDEKISLSSVEFKKEIQEHLNNTLLKFFRSVEAYVEDYKGTDGYLNEIAHHMNATIKIPELIQVEREDSQSKKIDMTTKEPYSFQISKYDEVKSYIEIKKSGLFKEFEKDLNQLRSVIESNNKQSDPDENKQTDFLKKELQTIRKKHIRKILEEKEKICKKIFKVYLVSLVTSQYEKFTRKSVDLANSYRLNFLDLVETVHLYTNEFRISLGALKSREEMVELYGQYLLKIKKIVLDRTNRIDSIAFVSKKKYFSIIEIDKKIRRLEESVENKMDTILLSRQNFPELSHFIEVMHKYFSAGLGEMRSSFLRLESDLFILRDDERILVNMSQFTEGLDQFESKYLDFYQILRYFNSQHHYLIWMRKLVSSLHSLSQAVQFNEKNSLEQNTKWVLAGVHTRWNILKQTVAYVVENEDLTFSNPSELVRLRKEVEQVNSDTQILIREWQASLAESLLQLSLKYDDFKKDQMPWVFLDRPLLKSAVLDLTSQLTNHSERDLVVDSLLAGWFNFIGYLHVIDSAHGQTRTLDSLESMISKIDLNQIRQSAAFVHMPVDDHYLPLVIQEGGSEPKGLTNFGNTCYLNAAVKAISTTDIQEIFSPVHTLLPRNNDTPESFLLREKTKKEFGLLLSALNRIHSSESEISVHHKSAFEHFGNLFRSRLEVDGPFSLWNTIQRDAAEILESILNEFAGSMSERFQLIMGTLNDALIDPKENTYEAKEDFILRLSLSDGLSTVQSALQKYYDDEDVFVNDRNGQKIRKKRRSRIVRAPETLIVQIGRYMNHASGRLGAGFEMVKSTVPIDPLPDLWLFESTLVKDVDLNPIRFKDQGREKNIQYQLKGIIYHLGEHTQAGHYKYVSYEDRHRMVIHDDSSVSLFENIRTMRDLKSHPALQEVVNNSYVFIYKRVTH